MTALLAFLLVLTIVGLGFVASMPSNCAPEPLNWMPTYLLNAPGMTKTSSN